MLGNRSKKFKIKNVENISVSARIISHSSSNDIYTTLWDLYLFHQRITKNGNRYRLNFLEKLDEMSYYQLSHLGIWMKFNQ